jgi:hypothetical protein
MTISFFVCQKLYKTCIQSKNQKRFQFNTEIVSGFVLCLDTDTQSACIAWQQGCTKSHSLTLAGPCIIIQFKLIKPTRCNSLQVLLLDVLCRSTCFGLLYVHHQELTTALTASGFTLERGDSSVVSSGLTITLLPPHSKVKPEAVNAVVSSWWWAWRCLKHVELYLNVK